jgi:hypothetical protein
MRLRDLRYFGVLGVLGILGLLWNPAYGLLSILAVFALFGLIPEKNKTGSDNGKKKTSTATVVQSSTEV